MTTHPSTCYDDNNEHDVGSSGVYADLVPVKMTTMLKIMMMLVVVVVMVFTVSRMITKMLIMKINLVPGKILYQCKGIRNTF